MSILILNSSIYAIDRRASHDDTTTVVEQIEIIDSLPEQFKPYMEIAFGFSRRVDESNLINHSPLIIAKTYYHLSDKVAGKIGFGYSSPNNFKSSVWETIGYRNLMLEIGFRWHLFHQFVDFYHENGIEYNYYFEPKSSIWEQRIGINFSFGIKFNIQQSLQMDISVIQTVNDASFNAPTKNIHPSLSPIGLKDGTFFNEVFNPAVIQILLFKKL